MVSKAYVLISFCKTARQLKACAALRVNAAVMKSSKADSPPRERRRMERTTSEMVRSTKPKISERRRTTTTELDRNRVRVKAIHGRRSFGSWKETSFWL